MLQSATEAYAEQARITSAAVIAAARAVDSTAVLRLVTAFQLLAARAAAVAVPRMLDEQGIDAPAAAVPAPTAVAGVASNGLPLEDLFSQVDQRDQKAQFDRLVATMVQDAARAAASVSMVTRPAVDGYVRMLNPPSCSRCAVLAGRFYKWNAGFKRHPLCDCRHIPSTEEGARYGNLTTNPNTYFDSLPRAAELDRLHPDLTVKMRREAGLVSQEDIFTVAGAKALRDGADISQVVNARRGMQKAQLWGHDAWVTTEGITRRGVYGHSQSEFKVRNVGQRGFVKNYAERTAKRARIMPETIYAVAKDRDDAIRLLKLYGFAT